MCCAVLPQTIRNSPNAKGGNHCCSLGVFACLCLHSIALCAPGIDNPLIQKEWHMCMWLPAWPKGSALCLCQAILSLTKQCVANMSTCGSVVLCVLGVVMRKATKAS